MRLGLHKATVYLKVYFAYKILNRGFFITLCKYLADFPMKEKYPKIKGLNLSGDHYFRNILFSEAGSVPNEEIEQIRGITPIIDEGNFPFVLHNNYIEVRIPADGLSVNELIVAIDEFDSYLSKLFEQNTGKKIEIHLRGGRGRRLSRQFVEDAIPLLPKGNYEYEFVSGGQVKKGSISLPSHFSGLPRDIEEIKEGIDIIYYQYSLKLIENKKKCIFKPVKKMGLGLSLYSDNIQWFKEIMITIEQANLFEQPLSANVYENLPSMTGT